MLAKGHCPNCDCARILVHRVIMPDTNAVYSYLECLGCRYTFSRSELS